MGRIMYKVGYWSFFSRGVIGRGLSRVSLVKEVFIVDIDELF